ncbi:MAG: hypothetical protein ACRERD_13840 [Candidatus Binatia bacterium]
MTVFTSRCLQDWPRQTRSAPQRRWVRLLAGVGLLIALGGVPPPR